MLRIASNGTGILNAGELHPDLVNRLAEEAAKTSKQILNMSIRALDYCPPVDINFGDYLRAIITADTDLVPDDDLGYRIAFIEAFRRRGIYPRDIRTLSPQSLCWKPVDDDDQQVIFNVITARLRFFIQQLGYLDDFPRLQNVEELESRERQSLRTKLIAGKSEKWAKIPPARRKEIADHLFELEPNFPFDKMAELEWSKLSTVQKEQAERILWKTMSDRERIHALTRCAQFALHCWLAAFKESAANTEKFAKFEELTGLYFIKTDKNNARVLGLDASSSNPANKDKYPFEVHSIRGSRRVGPDGNTLNEVIISLTQQRVVPLDETVNLKNLTKEDRKSAQFQFRGGCTLILDLQTLKLKYVIKKLIDNSDGRLTRQRQYRQENDDPSLAGDLFRQIVSECRERTVCIFTRRVIIKRRKNIMPENKKPSVANQNVSSGIRRLFFTDFLSGKQTRVQYDD